jgi:hypothetical protein
LHYQALRRLIHELSIETTIMSADDGEVPENNDGEEVAAQEGEVHEWSAFYDDDGRIYYYNSVNGESSWDPPEKFNPPPAATQEASTAQAAAADTETDPVPQETTPAASGANAWVAYQDDEGREYFFNTVTEETTWDQPEGFEPSSSAPEGGEPEEAAVSPVRAASPDAMDDPPHTPEQDEPTPMETQEDKSPKPEPEEEIDPTVKRLEDARAALDQTDAIMEPGESLRLVHTYTYQIL